MCNHKKAISNSIEDFQAINKIFIYEEFKKAGMIKGVGTMKLIKELARFLPSLFNFKIGSDLKPACQICQTYNFLFIAGEILEN